MLQFIFWMFFASGLGLIKMAVLAIVLDSQDYGYYVSIFGLGTLLGSVGSFGVIEKTVKLYPRLWVEGKLVQILQDARLCSRVLLYRFALLSILCIPISFVFSLSLGWLQVLTVFLLGTVSAWLALLASLFRALGSKHALQQFSISRGAVVCIASLSGGALLSWKGAVAGDVIASAVVGIFASFQIKSLFAKSAAHLERGSSSATPQLVSNCGHGQLYMANMLTASTSMADRALVASACGAGAAGTYGVLMLLPQVSQMLVNIISQYIGPLIIKRVHLAATPVRHGKSILLQGLLLALFIILLMSGAILLQHTSFIVNLFTKYHISDVGMMLSGFLALSQIYGLIEFHLIANDAERYIFLASLLSNFMFYVLFVLGANFSMTLNYFIGIAVIVRWLQITILIYGLSQSLNYHSEVTKQ